MEGKHPVLGLVRQSRLGLHGRVLAGRGVIGALNDHGRLCKGSVRIALNNGLDGHPVLKRRPRQKRLSLLARHQPVAAFHHFTGDLRSRRLLALNRQIADAQKISSENKAD